MRDGTVSAQEGHVTPPAPRPDQIDANNSLPRCLRDRSVILTRDEILLWVSFPYAPHLISS